MQFTVDVLREQHTPVRVEAGNAKQACEIVEDMYNKGKLESLKWYGFRDALSLQIVREI